jgi:hypothetical protein
MLSGRRIVQVAPGRHSLESALHHPQTQTGPLLFQPAHHPYHIYAILP